MENKFVTYLTTIGLSDVLIKRVIQIYSFCKDLAPEEITDIFVDNYQLKDGGNNYKSLWFFSGNTHVMEVREFIDTEMNSFDILSILDQIVYCKFEKRDYDFKKATSISRLSLEIWFRDNIELPNFLNASGINCDFLKDIYMRLIKPNMKKSAD